jgi:tRNA1(Val) A37 N6-methylase TrmN6
METIDTTILAGRVRLKQPKEGGLRVTIDSVFCAAACPAKPGERVCDLGAGTGVVGLCVAARVGNIHLTFVELQPDFAELALKNAALNDVQAESFTDDVRVHKGQYDHIVMNPPYLEDGTYWASPDAKRAKAVGRMEGDADLNDWIACAARCLKDKGSVTIVHRADALAEVLEALHKNRFGAVEIWPLHSYADSAANRIVVRALLGRRTKLVLHPQFVLHTGVAGEKYSAEAEDVLSGAQGL